MKNRFNNAMQMKSYIKQQAKNKNIDPRLLIQEFVLDDLLERISLSQYRNNFVLKGGFLIASLLGVDTRSTHDLDTTVVGLKVESDKLMMIFKEICEITPEDDPISLFPIKIETIRNNDKYGGYRIHFEGIIYNKIKPQIKIDVSTGDIITPRAINYHHKLITEDRTIPIAAYNIETILSEKLETIISRGALNSRFKDFYDIYALLKLEHQNINFMELKQALINTSKHRSTFEKMDDYAVIVQEILLDSDMNKGWEKYQKGNSFSKEISFEDTCKSIMILMSEINWK